MRLAKHTRICLAAVLFTLAGAWASIYPSSALAWTAPAFLPGTPNDMYSPRIAAEGNRVHVVFFRNESKELFYSRGTTAADGTVSWEPPRSIAKEVRFGWAITASLNGTLHVAYGTTDKRLLYIKNTARGDFGNWSSPELIASIPNQANELEIALDDADTPCIVWGQGVGDSVLVVACRNSNATWQLKQAGQDAALHRYATLVVTGSGDSAIIHVLSERKEDDDSRLGIVYARGPRNGSLQVSDFSRPFIGQEVNAAQPTIAVDRATGTLYAGFFSGKDLSFAFYFTYSTTNGASWADDSRLTAGGSTAIVEKSPIVAGPGTAYILLNARRVEDGGFTASGFYDTRFDLNAKRFTEPNPVRALAGTDYKNVSPDYAIGDVAKVAVWVTGFTERLAYSGDPGGITGAPRGTVVVNNGVTSTNNPQVTVTFSNVSGTPTQMRVAVDGAPTASTPLQPYQQSFTLALPASSACQRTVSAVLVNASGTPSEVTSASITVDSAVQAYSVLRNPYRTGNAIIYTAQTNGQIVNNGAANYTRKQAFYLEVGASAECTGLKQVQIGTSTSTLGAPYPATGTFFANVLPIPGEVAVGPNTVTIAVQDVAGNTRTFSDTIYYDPQKPILSTRGQLSVQVPASGVNVLVALKGEGSVVGDNMYPGRGYWGMWIANSRTQVANPLTDAGLIWTAVEVPTSDDTLRNWNLLNNIPAAQQTAGDYFVYARFLDGAGNPTDAFLEAKVTLNAVVKPSASLPLVVK